MFGSLRYNIGTARPVRMHKKKAGKPKRGHIQKEKYIMKQLCAKKTPKLYRL